MASAAHALKPLPSGQLLEIRIGHDLGGRISRRSRTARSRRIARVPAGSQIFIEAI